MSATIPVRSPYAEEPCRALRNLGVDPYAAVRFTNAGFREWFPSFVGMTYHTALKHAWEAREVEAADSEGQLRWLAAQMVVNAPGFDHPFMYWRESWAAALERLAVRVGPSRLSRTSRLLLLRTLADEPHGSRSSLPDALTVAIANEMNIDVPAED